VPVIARRRPGRLSAGLASRLAGKLTARDRRIALDCYDHRALTTEQLRRLHFTNLRVAQRRLRELHELRVLERFRPPWQPGQGPSSYRWTLDEAGARIVAAQLDVPREQLAWSRNSTLALAGSSKLAHLLAVNEFFTRLAAEAAEAGGGLREWWGERRAAAAFGGALAPDGYGRVELAGSSLALLLELDRGSEPHARLQEKERRYLRELPASDLAEQHPLVLLLVPSAARAEHAAAALDGNTLAVQVWTPDSGRSPLALLRDAHPRDVPGPDNTDLAPPPAPHA
jgi:hypothetical protein